MLLQSAEEWAKFAGAPEPSSPGEVLRLLLGNDATGSFILELATTAGMIVLVSLHRTATGMIHAESVAPLTAVTLALAALFGCGCLAITDAITMSQGVQLGMGIALGYVTHVGFSAKASLGDVSGVMRQGPRKGGRP